MFCMIFINVGEENGFCSLVINQKDVPIKPTKHKVKLLVLSHKELENYCILFHPLNPQSTYHA